MNVIKYQRHGPGDSGYRLLRALPLVKAEDTLEQTAILLRLLFFFRPPARCPSPPRERVGEYSSITYSLPPRRGRRSTRSLTLLL